MSFQKEKNGGPGETFQDKGFSSLFFELATPALEGRYSVWLEFKLSELEYPCWATGPVDSVTRKGERDKIPFYTW